MIFTQLFIHNFYSVAWLVFCIVLFLLSVGMTILSVITVIGSEQKTVGSITLMIGLLSLLLFGTTVGYFKDRNVDVMKWSEFYNWQKTNHVQQIVMPETSH